jgi:hypothetical protein
LPAEKAAPRPNPRSRVITATVTTSAVAITSPGTMPATNRSPIDTLACQP